MPPVNTKEKMALHLVSQPSDLSTAGVKDKELFIHNTLHRHSTDRAMVAGVRGRKGGKNRERESKREEKNEKKSGTWREKGREEKRKWLLGLCIKRRTVLF